jgi:hypothetical protein
MCGDEIFAFRHLHLHSGASDPHLSKREREDENRDIIDYVCRNMFHII